MKNNTNEVNWAASWIWSQDEESPQNYYMYARGSFELADVPSAAMLHVSADSRYNLFLNGKYLGRGPVRSDPRWQYYDSYDVASLLQPGKNTVAAVVHFYGDPVNAHGLLTRGGFICQIEEPSADGSRVLLKSDDSWKALRAAAWRPHTIKMRARQDFVEIFDARLEPGNWNQVQFDDQSWPSASVIGKYRPGSGHWISQDPSYTPHGAIQPWIQMVPRDIPFLKEEMVAPQQIAGMGESLEAKGNRPAASFQDPAIRIACDAKMPLNHAIIEHPENLLRPKNTHPVLIENHFDIPAVGTTVAGRDVIIPNAYLVLDFGKQVNGYFHLKLDGVAGGMVDIGYSEVLVNGQVNPLFQGSNGSRYIMRDGMQEWETFMWGSYRYVHLAFRNMRKPIHLYEANLRFSTYPVEYKGSFACSDETLTAIWEVARYTNQLCMMDASMDNPSDEQRHYIQTGRITSLVSYAAFGDTSLARKLLLQIAQSRMPDGCVHVAWPDAKTQRELSAEFLDGPLLYIQAIWEYFLFSGDFDLLRELYPVVLGLIRWFERWADADGLLANVSPLVWIDHAALERYGKVAIVNLWHYENLTLAARMAELMDDRKEAERLRISAEAVASAFHEAFWDADKGLYADCIHAGIRRGYSEHTNAMAYLIPLGRKQYFEQVYGKIYSGKQPAIKAGPCFQLFIIDAWRKNGRGTEAIELLRQRFAGLIQENVSTFGTMWTQEGPHVVCQSEAAAPAYLLSTHVLGICPLQPGFDEFLVEPEIAALTWARGEFPTRHGNISIEWKRGDGQFALHISVPEDAIARVLLPNIGQPYKSIYVDEKNVLSNGRIAEGHMLLHETGRHLFKVGPGRHQFVAKLS